LEDHEAVYGIPARKGVVVDPFDRKIPKTIRYEVTLEAPKVYTRPWTMKFKSGRIRPATASWRSSATKANANAICSTR
jgi:hypothetical protein